jgi:arginyl-tRNA synthetase
MDVVKDVYAHLKARIVEALKALEIEGALPAALAFEAIEVSPPREAERGDVASNAALVLAKPARTAPRELAAKLAARLEGDPDVARVEVAGPGFLNISLVAGFWQRALGAILEAGPQYGRAELGAGVKTNVEYVSTNPTGPVHVGHGRGAVFGDALGNLLAFTGHTVTREYYVNDTGQQVDMLARSVYLRYREALGEAIGEIPAGLYPGEYLKPVGVALANARGRALLDLPDERWLAPVRERAVAQMLALIREDLAALGIHHEVFFCEHTLTMGRDQVAETIEELRQRGLIYVGRLERPKGRADADWEDREQTLFKSTAFGDDVDRALKKSDGSYTYFAADMAYHRNKLARGFTQLINVLGADHVGYVTRQRAAVSALSAGRVDLDVKVCQLVKLYRAGEPVKMSKRAGAFITLREVVEEVGSDAVRFMMLYRKNDAPLDFDLAKVVEQSKDNPVFYVQYAHARTASVLRNAKDAFPGLDLAPAALARADLSRLNTPGEIELIKKMAAFPSLIDAAARAHEPHRLAFYLYDLASSFHAHWAKGNESPHLRFIQPDDGKLTASRLALVLANQQILATGLRLLGVHAPDEMR